MAKLRSVPPFPSMLIAPQGISTNYVLNKTPEGEYQVAKTLVGGGAEAEHEELFTGNLDEAKSFWADLARKEFP